MSVNLTHSTTRHASAAASTDAAASAAANTTAAGGTTGKGEAFGAVMSKHMQTRTGAAATSRHTTVAGQGHAHLNAHKQQDGAKTTSAETGGQDTPAAKATDKTATETASKTADGADTQAAGQAPAATQDSTAADSNLAQQAAAQTDAAKTDTTAAANAQPDTSKLAAAVDTAGATDTQTGSTNSGTANSGTSGSGTTSSGTTDAATLALVAAQALAATTTTAASTTVASATGTEAAVSDAVPAAAMPPSMSTPMGKALPVKGDSSASHASRGKGDGFANALMAADGDYDSGQDMSQISARDASAVPRTDAKDAVNRVRSSLDIFTQASQAQQGQAMDTQGASVPTQNDTSAATPAFSLQAAADTQSTYTATGAATASNMSQAAVENLAAMSVQMTKKLSEGNTKFTMDLHPADLGKVQVTLNIGSDGKTTAHLQFDSPVTASAFQSHEGELRSQLAQSGLTFDADALTFSSRSDGDAGFGSAFAQQQQNSQQQGQSQQDQSQQARQAARAMQAAGRMADDADIGALDASLASFRNRPSSSTLALNVIV